MQMGTRGSKAVKRISSLFSSSDDDSMNEEAAVAKWNGASPFVLTRKGSMYIDEDGDVAHEFYEEEIGNNHQMATMRRITANLRPQGRVPYEYPRLNADVPIILCEM